MTTTEVTAPVAGSVAAIATPPGTAVDGGQALVYLEIMKMEQPVTAPTAGVVTAVAVAVGDQVEVGQTLVVLTEDDRSPGTVAEEPVDDQPRRDLAEVQARRAKLTDAARPDAVAGRHDAGHRTARENVADLVDPGSFSEYGGLAIAAQRSRRSVEELLERTPADGLITGTATVNAEVFGPDRSRVAVAAYDYTVLAGTQGHANHHKKDRLFKLATRRDLPVVVYAEGGGGRPGDTDVVGGSLLDAEAFALFAALSGQVPLVAVVNGRCFAGNAALAGSADVIIATAGSSLGMAGPAMIEGGGLGEVDPDDIGPMPVQTANGVVDVLVDDEAQATQIVKHYLSFTQGPVDAPDPPDQTPCATWCHRTASASTTCAGSSTSWSTLTVCWSSARTSPRA